ncbi:DDE-domain-containing protein, partial [Calocera cornea HHB12733]
LSNGWLQHFKEQHNLKEWHFHGEAGLVPPADVNSAVQHLCTLTNQFAPEDIFNMDESGLNDRMPPDQGLASQQCSSMKGNKHWISLVFTANLTGMEHLPPMFIGHSFQPWCFKKKTSAQLGCDYHANKKVWMTGGLFQK